MNPNSAQETFRYVLRLFRNESRTKNTPSKQDLPEGEVRWSRQNPHKMGIYATVFYVKLIATD